MSRYLEYLPVRLVLVPVPEERLCVVHDALAGLVVGVGEEDVPVRGQGQGVHSEAVVLAGDEAALRALVDAGLVVASVTIPEDVGGGAHYTC